MNADAAKWLADYEKIIPFETLRLKGNEVVLAYDINNPEMYEKLIRNSKTLLIMDDADFFARWQGEIDVIKDCNKRAKVKTWVPDLVVCTTIEQAISEIKKGGTNRAIGLLIRGGDECFSWSFVNEWEKNKMKKFDLVVGNPPYSGDLHLQILDKFVKISKDVVFVHPGRWIEDVLAEFKSNQATGKKYAHLKAALKRVFMIKQKDGCQLFNIGLPQDMMIGVYENGKDNGGNLPIYDDSDRFNAVLEKVLNYAHNIKSLGDMTEENKIDGIRVEVKMIQASNKFSDTEVNRQYDVMVVMKQIIDNGYVGGVFWSEARRKCGNAKLVGTPIPCSIKFRTNTDAQEFINLYGSNVVKNIIYMLKYDQNAGHTHIPYFDPKTIKTEDDVLDALGITNKKHRAWLKREVYDYRDKDFIKYNEWIDC